MLCPFRWSPLRIFFQPRIFIIGLAQSGRQSDPNPISRRSVIYTHATIPPKPAMAIPSALLTGLFNQVGFTPSAEQLAAILHGDGPLHIIAGPGSGKTRVLLWRVVHLIVERGVAPSDIFLGTFSEKAARQLLDGLTTLIALASEETQQSYDLTPMYVGTIHSLCQRLLEDRDFGPPGAQFRIPRLLDEVDQYFHVASDDFWKEAAVALNFTDGVRGLKRAVNEAFGHTDSSTVAVSSLVALFNRLSEECLAPADLVADSEDDETLLFSFYEHYCASLANENITDFSLLQQAALRHLKATPNAERRFQHVLVDEYQDTNTVQERLVFKLASGQTNLTVVGDDDQALYRFRGATVENFVDFPSRAGRAFGVPVTRSMLSTNYRSLPAIVKAYRGVMDAHDWQDSDTGRVWRVEPKKIEPFRPAAGPEFLKLPAGSLSENVAAIVATVEELVRARKVEDVNQIAVLFASLKTKPANDLKAALADAGFKVHAPRMELILCAEEVRLVAGLIAHVVSETGVAPLPDDGTSTWDQFANWRHLAWTAASQAMDTDPALANIVHRRRTDIAELHSDASAIKSGLERRGWTMKDRFDGKVHATALSGFDGLSGRAQKALRPARVLKYVARRSAPGKPVALAQVLALATTADWNLLDLFYEFLGTRRFVDWLDEAKGGVDEGPAANLGQASRIITRYMDQSGALIRGLADPKWLRINWETKFLWHLFAMGDAVDEDDVTPFPKGRIPFLTIHQSKGLEFPVVIMPILRSKYGESETDRLVARHLRGEREPRAKAPTFDFLRKYYVGFSRAENLLIVGNINRGRGSHFHKAHEHFEGLVSSASVMVSAVDLAQVPHARAHASTDARKYSYTSDFLAYNRCPRHYMLFRKFGFAETRVQTMLFGSLVHATIDDFHRRLIHASKRSTP